MEKKIQIKREGTEEETQAHEGEVLTAEEIEAEMRFQRNLFKQRNQ